MGDFESSVVWWTGVPSKRRARKKGGGRGSTLLHQGGWQRVAGKEDGKGWSGHDEWFTNDCKVSKAMPMVA